jgi:hypothetical protein
MEVTKILAGLYVRQKIQLPGLMVGKLLEFMNGSLVIWIMISKVPFVSSLLDSIQK